MIIPSKIKTAFFGLVGWNQPTISEYAIVDSDNLISDSGLKFDESSALVSIQNIHRTQPDVDISDANFNKLLTNMQHDCILKTVNRVVGGQSNNAVSFNLYPFEKAFDKTITPGERFVGFRIEPKTGLTNILNIPWVELTFDSVRTFYIYLYNSNLSEPILKKEVTTVANESVIVNLDWNLIDDVTYKGGVFYLGYFETALAETKAIERDYENANVKMDNSFYHIEPFYTDYVVTKLNVQNVEYSSEIWGLNIGINIFSDYTELAIRHKSIFARAIQLSMAEKVLNLIKNSTRTNDIERISDINTISFELYGNPDKFINGVFQDYEQETNTIKKILFNDNPLMLSTLG